MADWFQQNAPKQAQQPGTDWFAKNAPLLSKPGQPVQEHPQAGLPDITNEDLAGAGRFALDALPSVAGAVGDMVPGPLGVAASGALGGLGEGVRQGVLAATGAEGAPQSIPEAMRSMGTEGLIQAGTSAVGGLLQKAAGKILRSTLNPEKLYQSALKPSVAKGAENAAKVVGTGLKERLPASEASHARAAELWDDLNRQVEGMIASGANRPIDPLDVTQRLDVLREKWNQTPEYLKLLDDIEENFLTQYQNPGSLTAATAQEKKKQLYKQVRKADSRAWDANRPAPSDIDVEAKKELARGLKEELQTMFPQLAALNEREGALIGLEKALDKFVARDGNRQITSIFTPFALGMSALSAGFGVGGAQVGHPEAGVLPLAAWLTRSVFENPGVKSRLAIALRVAGEKVPKGTTKVINLPNAIRAARETMFAEEPQKKTLIQ